MITASSRVSKNDRQLTGRADPDVWSAAQSARRFLITQDLDFSDIRRYKPGTHAGLLPSL